MRSRFGWVAFRETFEPMALTGGTDTVRWRITPMRLLAQARRARAAKQRGRWHAAEILRRAPGRKAKTGRAGQYRHPDSSPVLGRDLRHRRLHPPSAAIRPSNEPAAAQGILRHLRLPRKTCRAHRAHVGQASDHPASAAAHTTDDQDVLSRFCRRATVVPRTSGRSRFIERMSRDGRWLQADRGRAWVASVAE